MYGVQAYTAILSVIQIALVPTICKKKLVFHDIKILRYKTFHQNDETVIPRYHFTSFEEK
jgi:hypothetical protein